MIRLIRQLMVLLTCFILGTHSSFGQSAYTIVSSPLPPFTVEQGAYAPGALGVLVERLAKHMGRTVSIEFYPWARALKIANNDKRVLILPLTRTAEREARFRWVIKLYRHNYVFNALKSNHVNLENTESLRASPVAVLRGSPNVEHLRALGFSQLVLESSVENMCKLLARGGVDAIYGDEAINLTTLKLIGVRKDAIVASRLIGQSEIWLGGSLDITEDESNAWRKAMADMVRSGEYHRLLKSYGLPD